MYQGHPRHDVTEILTELVLNLVCDQANLLEGFVIVYACLISLVYNFIGADVGASIVQSLVECLDKSYQEHNESVVIAADQSVLPSKRSTNLTLLLCHLYNFQVVSQVLLYDLLDLFAGSLQELDVELLLKIIRSCGPKLRSDDPLRLKNMIVLLQEKSAQRNEPLTVRHKFMLEQIYDLKNNKSQKHLARELAEKTDSLRKLQRNLMKQYGSQGHEPLRCSLDDIHSVQQKGKWWVIGAAWVGRQSGQEHESLLVNQRADNELLALAKRMNINTDIRRSIFVVLMSSEDYADAFEKLLKLGLRDSQEREIVRMIVYLCGQVCYCCCYYC
jgi:nucleolar MIF4G domain-containing protein 1